jgi:hypothetical protein
MTTPKTWGKHFWYTLHIVSLAYPEFPTLEQTENYQQFFTNFGKVLPCKKCSKNYQRHLKELPITDALVNRKSLFDWSIKLHNIVNKELGRDIWNNEYALAYYLNGDYDKYHNSYMSSSRVLNLIMIILNLVIICIIFYYLLHKQL